MVQSKQLNAMVQSVNLNVQLLNIINWILRRLWYVRQRLDHYQLRIRLGHQQSTQWWSPNYLNVQKYFQSRGELDQRNREIYKLNSTPRMREQLREIQSYSSEEAEYSQSHSLLLPSSLKLKYQKMNLILVTSQHQVHQHN